MLDYKLPMRSLSLVKEICKGLLQGYSITLQEFKRNEGRVRGT